MSSALDAEESAQAVAAARAASWPARPAAQASASDAPPRVWPAWLGPALAALSVLVAALPGLIRLPAFDRDEARFAQATAQMLETGDFVNIRYQEEARDKKPIGIHWLQAVSVGLLSTAERREIWAYRLPSLLGAMGGAAACAWGAQGFWGRRRGALAGAMLGVSQLLSSEALLATTDAVLCGAVTLSMVSLGRLYAAHRGVGRAEGGTRLLVWAGLGVAILVKGPVGPTIAALTIAALCLADRDTRWLRALGWRWGLLLLLALVGPWAVAITVSTDGAFWSRAVDGDLAPKLAGGHEGHGAPPLAHLLLSPLLLFPASLLLPAALAGGWARRREPGVRFALAWLLPAWLGFELMATKLPHYPLPLYGALAWLGAAALEQPVAARSRWGGAPSRWGGAALSAVSGLTLAGASIALNHRFGDAAATAWTAATAALYAGAGAAGALLMLRGRTEIGLLAAGGLAVLGHAVFTGGLAPALKPLWTSARAARMLDATKLDPRNGVTPGPVAVAGYAEPSLVFSLGTVTDLGDAGEAAQASADGQPVLVERGVDRAYRQALARLGARAEPVGQVRGYNYSKGQAAELTLWKPILPPEPAVVFDSPVIVPSDGPGDAPARPPESAPRDAPAPDPRPSTSTRADRAPRTPPP